MLVIFSLTLLALGLAQFAPVDAHADSEGWVNVGGRFLKFYSTPKTFDEANAVCAGFGGLVVYDDHPSVNKYLALRGGLQWIGGTDNGHEGKWTWTNGNPMPKGHWYPGEPNNCCGGQNCAVVNFQKPGLWDDVNCGSKKPFHCQIHRIGYVYGVRRRVMKVHPEKKNWQDAAATCHAEGGELVKVNNPEVSSWLARQDPKLGHLWVGARDEGHEGKFTWSDGQPADLAKWSPGEPNNCCGGQNCAVVNWKQPGIWDDQGCQLLNPFVCQIVF